MAELGQIEKPSAENFAGKRKLYCVPNIYPIKDAPDDYTGLVERYWDEVTQQIEKLESAGKVKKIFCESIFVQGQEAFNALERLNEKALQIVKKRTEEGAVFLPIEREDIFSPFIDWANCLNVVRTKDVFDKVYEFYTELSERRLKYIQNVIEGSLSEGEAGLLIMRDEDRIRLQFPNDIEVFLVTPPSYDDILRWFREKGYPKKS
jgi:hypothetical protein